ncbi:MAG: phytanoyl-CoA dioxygenase family protein [Trueperaceae bacterium]|nr:phytanoyl-CoA dioxygenase family protein [Trueperaceae bacterium]
MSDIKAFFDENGYYHAKGVFSKEEVAKLEHEFDHIVAQLVASGEKINATWMGPEMKRIQGKDDIIIHTHNVQQFSRVWLDAMLHEKFLDIASEILGEDIVLHHSKLFQKPSEKGSPFPMHQDWSYFPTIKDSMIAGIIHVSKATDEMGCLRVYEGSHKVGRVLGSGGQNDSEFLEDYPIENAKIVEAEAGDVLFFHYFTLHGSMPNRSTDTRKTVLVQMYAGDDRIEDGNKHPDERLTLKGWNHHSTRDRAGWFKG